MTKNEKFQLINCINQLDHDAHFGTLIVDNEEFLTIKTNGKYISFIDLEGDVLEFEIELVIDFTFNTSLKPNRSKMVISLSNGITHIIEVKR